MKVLWLPAPGLHPAPASSSLLSLCLSIYSAGRVRKGGKRLAGKADLEAKSRVLHEVTERRLSSARFLLVARRP